MGLGFVSSLSFIFSCSSDPSSLNGSTDVDRGQFANGLLSSSNSENIGDTNLFTNHQMGDALKAWVSYGSNPVPVLYLVSGLAGASSLNAANGLCLLSDGTLGANSDNNYPCGILYYSGLSDSGFGKYSTGGSRGLLSNNGVLFNGKTKCFTTVDGYENICIGDNTYGQLGLGFKTGTLAGVPVYTFANGTTVSVSTSGIVLITDIVSFTNASLAATMKLPSLYTQGDPPTPPAP